MKTSSLNIFLLYYLVLFSTQVTAENSAINNLDFSGWEASKLIEKNNIKVELYKHNNSVMKAFKVDTHLNASLDSILAVMMDSRNCMEWVHGCKGSKVIKRVSFNEQYHYQICDVPFPFRDRDFIFHSKMRQDPKTKMVTITIASVPDYCTKNQSELCSKINQSDLVRVKRSIGVYKLKPDENGTSVTWIQHTDPAGNLPAWLVNQFVQDTPYWTMVNLAKNVEKSQYKQSKLVYNKKGIAVSFDNIEKETAPENLKFGRFASF